MKRHGVDHDGDDDDRGDSKDEDNGDDDVASAASRNTKGALP